MISWEIRDTGESGQGVFATRLIQPGETIIEDWQFFDAEGEYAPEWIYTLKNSIKGLPEVRGIIGTNQIKVGKNLHVYKYFSKFNHSCNPNAENFGNRENMVIVAIKPIRMGEQITVSYYKSMAYLNDIEDIHAYIKKIWRFDCNCDLEQAVWRVHRNELKDMLKGVECVNEDRLDELMPLLIFHHPIIASYISINVCQMYVKAEMVDKAMKYRDLYIKIMGPITRDYPECEPQKIIRLALSKDAVISFG